MGGENVLFIGRQYVIHAVFLLFLDGFQCDRYLKDIPIRNRGGVDVPWTTDITAWGRSWLPMVIMRWK